MFLKTMLLISIVFSSFATFADVISEREMIGLRHSKYKDYDVLFEDANIQVLARMDCGYEDMAYHGLAAQDMDILYIEQLKARKLRRKGITILVYNKNTGIDDQVVALSSDNAGKFIIEPDQSVIDHALKTYVPKAAARCPQANFILARQEFYAVERIKEAGGLPFNTFIGFEKDGNTWSLEDTYTYQNSYRAGSHGKKKTVVHTIRSIVSDPLYAEYYSSIKNPNYSYYDGVFLGDNGGTTPLPGITYKEAAFWQKKYEVLGDVFQKVFEGYFMGARSENLYHVGFTLLVEANSNQCGSAIKGDASVVRIESYTRVTDEFGTYDKDHKFRDVKLKTRYVAAYKSARKEPAKNLKNVFSVNADNAMDEASNYLKARVEASEFLKLAGCESALANQLFENFYRSITDLQSLQDEARSKRVRH